MRDRFKFASEVDLGKAIVEHLERDRWDVYQEVAPGSYGHGADIVAVRGPLLMVVELKMGFNIAVLAQAARWVGHAHYAVVATPTGRDNAFNVNVCKAFGVGWVEAAPKPEETWLQGEKAEGIRWRLAPAFHRPNKKLLAKFRAALHPEQKTYLAAGSPGGGGFTPWRAFCEAVAKAVKAAPGITVKETILAITHHYPNAQSACSAALTWIRAGQIKGVRIDVKVRPYRLYPA